MFGRATITLGIGPHFSFIYYYAIREHSIQMHINLNAVLKRIVAYVTYSSTRTFLQINGLRW